ncbi:hypothetical protein Q5H93_15600 [Hymenobacter sp. ASUV-10]|uniref:DUF805 domain-containing protein n=1 Tax=Hymenobacter aranciens TaxID=3063996 RepID=A0ABT9BD44_9BACT|nr:hypothetical protein [Hymenobacter sp. ASUV-10]MDO7876169.1 hypothetical protein [Hymenobacter sp. ASUV-10]
MFFSVLVGVVVFFALTFPVLTGYIAASNGRSFWRWYGLGLVLPLVSVFVVMVVATRDQLAEDKRAAGVTPE